MKSNKARLNDSTAHHRLGPLAATSVGLRWTSSSASPGNVSFTVRWRAEPTRTPESYLQRPSDAWDGGLDVSRGGRTALVVGLAPGSSYAMIVEEARGGEVCVGLGRIVALYHRSSSSDQIH
jgi:hypothetical protein